MDGVSGPPGPKGDLGEQGPPGLPVSVRSSFLVASCIDLMIHLLLAIVLWLKAITHLARVGSAIYDDTDFDYQKPFLMSTNRKHYNQVIGA